MPAHGGDDYGFVENGIKEKDFTLKVTNFLEEKLSNIGLDIYKTRNNDETLSNKDRLKIINNYDDAIVITSSINPNNEKIKIIYSNNINEDILNNIKKIFEQNVANTKESIIEKQKDFYYLNRNYPNTIRIEYTKDCFNDERSFKDYFDTFVDKITSIFKVGKDEAAKVFNYTVSKKDTLFNIAKKFKTSVQDIKKVNNLDSNLLKINQNLNIPINEDNIYHKVKKGDSLWNIAKKYDVNIEELKDENNIDNNKIYLNQMLIIPKKD